MSKRKAYAKRMGAVAAAAAIAAGTWTLADANAQPAPPPDAQIEQPAPDQPAGPPPERPLRQRDQRRIHQPDGADWQGPPPGGRGYGGQGPAWNDEQGPNAMPPQGPRGEGKGIYVGPGRQGERRGPRFEDGQERPFGPPPGGEFDGPRGHRPPDPAVIFDEMDADKNGTLTREEFIAFHETHRPPRMHAQGPGQGQGPGRGLGQGPGQGRGPGRGQGPGFGPGQGRGPGHGPAQDGPMPPAPPAGDLPPAPIE